MTTTRKPRIPPKDEAEWHAIERDFSLGPDHRMLIAAGRQAWTRWREISRQIDADGIVVGGRYAGAPRAHPLLGAEIRARGAVVQILNTLDLPEEAP